MKTKNRRWSRLDNVAKLFPPTSDRKDTRVFRFACELYEGIRHDILQEALERALQKYEYYRSVLKKGLFWYYFEESGIKPRVTQENLPPCAPIYDPNRKDLLFRVSCYHNRINLEIYHALSDGTGALSFLRLLVTYYLQLRYPDVLGEATPDFDASPMQVEDDSFEKYYNKHKVAPPSQTRAYNLRGETLPEYRYGIIEGLVSVEAMMEIAHTHQATLSEYLTAVFISAVHANMSRQDERRPVTISIPVNLRRYFSSQTSRNFFSVVNVSHDFRRAGNTIEDILRSIRGDLARELRPDTLEARMGSYAAIERNIATRFVPLALKIPVLKIANYYGMRGHTATLSNVGRVEMPKKYRSYIRLFDVFSSTRDMQICICSFEDNMVLSFSSFYRSTDIQMEFFRTLTRAGVRCEISTNMGDFRMEDRT